MDDLKKFSWGRFFELLIVMFFAMGGGLFLGLFFSTGLTDNPFLFIKNSITSSEYKYYSTIYINDTFISKVVDFCGYFENEEQVECVVENVGDYYVYKEHNEIVKKPEDFLNEGGVCRDIAVLYDSIFSRLNYYTEFRFDKPEHVFNMISNNDIICFVDGKTYVCS